jgi:serine/threonine protein kinase
VRVLNYFQSAGGQRLFVVQPYVAGGDLLDYFNTTCCGKGLPEPQAKGLLRQAVEGLQYLKLHHVAHGDLSPENLALDGSGNVVVLDLGMCRVVPPSVELLPAARFRGKHAYAPLETFKGQRFDPWAADVFSLGATLFVLLCGEKFWAAPVDFRDSHLHARIERASRRRQVPLSTEARHLLGCMLHPEPHQRPTLDAILGHAWLQEAAALQGQGDEAE